MDSTNSHDPIPHRKGAPQGRRPPTAAFAIIGRDTELAALTAVVLGTGAGPRFAVVEGAAGIGKSRLLSAAAHAAEEAGSLVLRARGIAGERDFPFGVVRQIFELLLGEAPVAERRAWLRGPARTVPLILDPGARGPHGADGTHGPDAAVTGHASAHALYWLTANIARRARLAIVVDDLQWADAPSLRWLTYLARRLDHLPVAVVAGLCGGDPGPDPGLVAELLSGVRRLRLSGLDAGSATLLIAGRLQAPPADEFVAGCLAETGGNPALLGGLIGGLAAEGRPPTADLARELPTLAPRQLGDAVAARLARSGVEAVRLVTAVAVLGEAELDVAARVAGLAPDTAWTAAAALARMGILRVGERVCLRHGLVRRALLARLAVAERGRLHLLAARVLCERSAPAAVVAEHLAEAGRPVGEHWVSVSLRDAALKALAAGMHQTARAHLRRLLAEPHEPAARAEYVGELGAAEIYLDLPAAVEHLRTAFVQLRAPGGIARVAHRLAGVLHDSGAAAEAVAVLARAAGRVEGADPDLIDGLTLHRLSLATWAGASDSAVPAGLDRLLDGLAHRDSPAPLLPWAQALRAFRLGLQAAGVRDARTAATAAIDAIAARGDLCEYRSVAAIRTAATALLHAGGYELAIGYCQRQAACAERRRERLLSAWARAVQGCAYNALGRYEQGAASARAALSALEAVSGDQPRPAAVLATVVLADSFGELGRCQQGLALLEGHQVGEGRPDRWVYDRALQVRARLRLAAGQPSGALADILEAGRSSQARGVTNPAAASWRLTAALAHAALGDCGQAVRLVQEEMDLARTAGLTGALAVALVAGAVLAQRPATLAEAIGILAGPDCSLARDPLRQALDLVRARGDRIVAGQLERHIHKERNASAGRALPTRPAWLEPGRRVAFGVGALTAHEQRLMALAVAGTTNGKIAEQFGVTRRAVELHFTHIYRKLGITSRLELHRFVDSPAG